jgi:molybdopterin-guanine dinucleotide biosynthesis protein A
MHGGCSLVILAGGLSRRMGRDKASLPAGDGTLIEHLARRLAPAVDETIVAGGSSQPALPGMRTVEDRYSGHGPLAGIHAGLAAARYPHVWVVACDLPDADPALAALFLGLTAGYDAVVPRMDGEPQGVCALYNRALVTRIDGLLSSGERRVKSLLAASNVRYVTSEELRTVDPELRSFRNINTPADYQAWLTTAPRKPMTAQEQYLARVNGLLDSVSALLSPEERAEVQHLIDRGEPAEGLRALAWIIVKAGKYVAPAAIADIRTLSEGLVPEEHMPPSLEKHALQPE